MGQVVTVKKISGQRLHQSETRNEATMREHFVLPAFGATLLELSNVQYFSKVDLAPAHKRLERREVSTSLTMFGIFYSRG